MATASPKCVAAVGLTGKGSLLVEAPLNRELASRPSPRNLPQPNGRDHGRHCTGRPPCGAGIAPSRGVVDQLEMQNLLVTYRVASSLAARSMPAAPRPPAQRVRTPPIDEGRNLGNSAASCAIPGCIGRLAQLVEHLVYTERVGGSSPSPPTIAAISASSAALRQREKGDCASVPPHVNAAPGATACRFSSVGRAHHS